MKVEKDRKEVVVYNCVAGRAERNVNCRKICDSSK